MEKSNSNTRVWTKPQLVRIGKIGDVALGGKGGCQTGTPPCSVKS